MARVRRSVWDLVADTADKTLEWYGKAIAAMKARPAVDHRSWRYQAAIHAYNVNRDPFFDPNDPLPPEPLPGRFLRRCQHQTWFFLPWHRMYLHHFEKIVAAEIVALGGPANWALPYWNYGMGPASRRIPIPFRRQTLSGGATNFLWASRGQQANAGGDFADDVDVEVETALRAPVFSAPSTSGTTGFGGPVTGFNHGAGLNGLLETSPHNNVHVAIGGWMGGPSTAGLDPIFWLHHANIDRLWEIWLTRRPTHANPNAPLWRNGVAFEFRDVSGNAVAMRSEDVLSTQAPPLDYEYDDIVDPLPLEAMGPSDVASERIPEMVGATEHPIRLGGEPVTAAVPMPTMAGQALESMGADDGPQHAYLHVENITAGDRPATYDVYLGVPDGVDPRSQPEKRIGRLSLFGIREASRADGPHAGSGLTYAFEVTEVVGRLKDQANWDTQRLQVSFVPVRGDSEVPVQVGRVSLYVS